MFEQESGSAAVRTSAERHVGLALSPEIVGSGLPTDELPRSEASTLVNEPRGEKMDKREARWETPTAVPCQ